MFLDLPCEYCGKPTQWDTRFAVPACCRECMWIPKLVAYISIIGIVGLLIAAVITYGVHQ